MCDVMGCEVFPHLANRRVKDSLDLREERERHGEEGKGGGTYLRAVRET